ncbi:putative mediator of RNA polymerase II transcription subunit 26b [Curcuma longa]|uniref:putative mediator of RNA polymerase II transcription subunit 26b n=1 Tax=Curcuma longa TaxID=136217 RepID=UPI003D9F9B67
MAGSPVTLDYWRKFLRSADGDIFEVMEQAVVVAATDYPDEFRSRRAQLAEKLFTVLLPRCFGCVGASDGEEGDGSVKRDDGVKHSSDDDGPEDLNGIVSNYSYDEAEALTEEIEEANEVVTEVSRIKQILVNYQDESDSVLFESLRRLQLMELSVEVLMATAIGRAVSGVRKHNSKQIRHLARTLIEGWKVLADEWVSATAAIPDNSPDSINLPMEDEEGLPFPPLDEGALFATQTAPMQLSKFFDEMDDDGNFRNNNGSKENRENRSIQINDPKQKQQPPNRATLPKDKGEARRQASGITADLKEDSSRQERRCLSNPEDQGLVKQKVLVKQEKLRETFISQANQEAAVSKQRMPASGFGKPSKLISEQKAGTEAIPKRIQDNSALRRKSSGAMQDKTKNSEDALIRAKLEVAKRKLQEGYQQAENVKKQRTIQVMELHDLPKKVVNKPQFSKSKNKIKGWANGRR